MKTYLHEAPFALASDGTVLLNVMHFDGVTDLETAIAVAGQQGGKMLVAVVAAASETEEALRRLQHGFNEAAAFAAGARRRRARQRQ